jgi:hypothetical protein
MSHSWHHDKHHQSLRSCKAVLENLPRVAGLTPACRQAHVRQLYRRLRNCISELCGGPAQYPVVSESFLDANKHCLRFGAMFALDPPLPSSSSYELWRLDLSTVKSVPHVSVVSLTVLSYALQSCARQSSTRPLFICKISLAVACAARRRASSQDDCSVICVEQPSSRPVRPRFGAIHTVCANQRTCGPCTEFIHP